MNMSKDTLELLLGSRARVRVLKFLFRSTGPIFSIKDISSRVQERPSVVKKEVRKLLEIGLLKQKNKQ